MGEWKLLLPWRGSTVVEWSVRHALDFCHRVFLVTGHRGQELRALFAACPAVEPVENRDYRLGMFSSIQAGVSRVESGRFFIALGDMPLVGGGIYRRLADAAVVYDAVRPTFAGRKGHPVLLHRALVPRIKAADPSFSMSHVLQGARVLELPTEDEGVVYDIDTLSDYDRRSLP